MARWLAVRRGGLNLGASIQIELLVIGSALVHRIEREQASLFPLYQASY